MNRKLSVVLVGLASASLFSFDELDQIESELQSTIHLEDSSVSVRPITISESKKLQVLQYLIVSPNGQLDHLVDSENDFESLETYRSFIMAGAIVPNWLHNALASNPSRHPFDAEMRDRLHQRAPKDSLVAQNERLMLRMAVVWFHFCIKASIQIPRSVNHCGRITDHQLPGEFENAYRLSKQQLVKYLNEVIRQHTKHSL